MIKKSIETYVSPICRSIAVKVEGVLCGSNDMLQANDWKEGTNNWFEEE